MANNTNNLPYPFQFDPSQFSNQYSAYGGTALPFMGQYAGMPTDAHGNPIASYQAVQAAQQAAQNNQAPMAPATTLNSTPAAQSAQPGFGAPMTSGNAAVDMANWGGFMSGPQQLQNAYGGGGQAAPAAPATPQAAAPSAGQQNMSQAYLQALANPGKVTTPGATVPQAQFPSQQSGVLQQFLQNWQNKGSPTTGAGNYNNAGFFSGLQGGQSA